MPLTEERIYAVAAQFKAQGYRSFANYIDTMSEQHKAEHEWTSGLDRARKKSLASTQRGLARPSNVAKSAVSKPPYSLVVDCCRSTGSLV